MDIQQVALIVHEANRMMQIVNGDPVSSTWECLEESDRERTVNGVAFALRNEDPSPEQMHDNWCKDMYADGYEAGEKLDRENLTHPNLVPYDELPVQQQAKDALFSGIVSSLSDFVS
jgi:hypothetical protein